MNRSPGDAGDLLHSPEVARLMKNKAALISMMNSPEGRRLMQLLQQNNGNTLQNAAQSASRGDMTAISGILNQLKNSQEGLELLSRLSEKLPK